MCPDPLAPSFALLFQVCPFSAVFRCHCHLFIFFFAVEKNKGWAFFSFTFSSEKKKHKKMWHETRRSERKVHDIMDAACKPAQRLAVFLAKRRGDPQQSIQVVGSRCRLYRDDDLYQATEQGQGLIPHNVLIDK